MKTPLCICSLLLAAGCAALDQDPTLTRFESCDDMRGYMKHVALREARGTNVVSFPGAFLAGCMDKAADADYAFAGGDEAPAEAASDYSETNTQEQGIDEADLVETDGTYIYAVASGHLVTSQAWPVEDAHELSRVPIDGEIDGIYYADDTVVAISQLWWERPHPRSDSPPSWDEEQPTGLVTVIDLSDRADPVVVRETYFTGELRGSRRIDDTLYVVAYLDVDLPGMWDSNLREVKALIREASAEDWIPRQQDNVLVGDSWQTTEGHVCDCQDVWSSNRESGTLFTHVMALDLSDPTGAFSGQGVVGEADVVYVSGNGIYVAYSETDEGPFRSLDDSLDTIIHKFDISDGSTWPRYVDTVQLWGVVLDQFSFSEYRDVLCVATTDQRVWTSSVWTLRDEDGQFVRLDHLDGLAPGEELYSSRFVGNIGYLVTYEVTENPTSVDFGDPLLTIDLSDPEHITAVGELVMNGWSDYIHPMDDDHLLTVGMDEDSDGDWKVAVSLFDVSDLENPALVDREILEAASSEAQTDHHAFNYFASQDALALPTWTTSGDRVLELLHVTTSEVSSIGRLRQSAINEAVYDPWCAQIRRSVFMEDKVWAMSEGGLTATAVGSPEDILQSVVFEGLSGCSWRIQ